MVRLGQSLLVFVDVCLVSQCWLNLRRFPGATHEAADHLAFRQSGQEPFFLFF